MEQKITLLELNEQIGKVLKDTLPTSVWVIAEISELKENWSGHCYLELVEKQGAEIVARARATIWSYTYRILKPYFETSTGQIFTHGLKILVQVSVEHHPAFGLSLNIKDIDPVYTVGEMAMQRKEIINRLQEEGVFEMNKELELPIVPQKVAVISSATAAGYQDFINQLENNEFGFKFYTKLFQATMQGGDSASSIIYALERIFQYEDFFDVVVIIRGGGATADLSSFDDYELAFHITQFPLPVITGIGHEKDDTIIDLIAHTRLKTPTAVAEFLIKGVEHYYEKMLEIENEIVNLAGDLMDKSKKELEQAAVKLNRVVGGFINRNQILLSRKVNELQRSVNRFSHQKDYELNDLKHNVKSTVSMWSASMNTKLYQKQNKTKHLTHEAILKQIGEINHIRDVFIGMSKKMIMKENERIHYFENSARLINPENVLKRGYTLTLKNGKIVKSSKQLKTNEMIETRFSDGNVKSKIVKNENHDK
jgi:exodeoxyribonuclease VII large subunit